MTSEYPQIGYMSTGDYPLFSNELPDMAWHNNIMLKGFDRELVRKTMKARGVNQQDLVNVAGLPSQSAMSNILNGSRQVKAGERDAIYEYLGLVDNVENLGFRRVPIIGFSSAGLWREAVAMPIGEMPVPPRIASDQAFAVEIEGDSCDLIIEDGGYVVVEPRKKELISGKFYLIQNSEHEVTVKRYRAGNFEPASRNGDHVSFAAADVDFIVLGQIVWKGAPV